MTSATRTPNPPDLEELEQRMRSLASLVRLRILWRLREPKRPSEVTVRADEAFADLPSDRLLSRSTVTEHIDKLNEVGLVQRVEPEGGYVVDRQGVVRTVNELRKLGRLEPVVHHDVEETVDVEPEAGPELPEGPKLILVSGPETGTGFPLEGSGSWTIGRDPKTDVALPFDPHVSDVQAVVTQADSGLYEVEAAPGTTNPTLLDFEELPVGRTEPLVPGSVLSLGSSRLVFKAV